MNKKKFIIILLSTFLIGTIPSLIVGSNLNGVITPSFFPPKILFPIVWTILYVLISISLYLATKDNNKAYVSYLLQLFFNSTWTILFFGFRVYFLSIIWILILIGIVIYMAFTYYKENKLSTYLLIPYLIWLLFALYLNIAIFILN